MHKTVLFVLSNIKLSSKFIRKRFSVRYELRRRSRKSIPEDELELFDYLIGLAGLVSNVVESVPKDEDLMDASSFGTLPLRYRQPEHLF
jgi:hypothetical protein